MGAREQERLGDAPGKEWPGDNAPNREPTQAPSTGSTERRALAVVLAAVCVYLVVASLARSCARGHVELDRSAERVGDLRLDLNRASWAELIQLPGVGPKLADRIIAYRQASGGFSRPEELEQVEGIGPKLLERIWPYVYVAAQTPETKLEPAGSGD